MEERIEKELKLINNQKWFHNNHSLHSLYKATKEEEEEKERQSCTLLKFCAHQILHNRTQFLLY